MSIDESTSLNGQAPWLVGGLKHFHVNDHDLLLNKHFKELNEGSGLSEETIRAAGIFSELDQDQLA
ncbi:MAG: hypothetical protein KDA61_20700, partial [Planctomycetales bacterium]|nr:hypothetical protein [Planctomycetales bacterium]